MGTTHQRERDRQSDLFQNCYIFIARRAGRRAGRRASFVALNVASVVELVCLQSRDCRVCRRVQRRVLNRARVSVFTLKENRECVLLSRSVIWGL